MTTAEDLAIEGVDQMEALDIEGSAIYRARQVSHNRLVAVKILEAQHEPLVPRRFDLRRKSMQRFAEDRGVVSIYGSGTTRFGLQYLIMPYFSIGSLADQLGHGPMPWHRAAELTKHTAEIVAKAHDLDVVLGDLKPSSILLADADSPLVSLYGMATKRFDDGRPSYGAPEAGSGSSPTRAGDVYSLSLILAALIAGRAPNRGPISPQFHREVAALAPARIVDVIKHGLAENPANRYRSADVLAHAIGAAISGDTSPPPGTSQRGAHPLDLDALGGFPPPPAPTEPASKGNGDSADIDLDETLDPRVLDLRDHEPSSFDDEKPQPQTVSLAMTNALASASPAMGSTPNDLGGGAAIVEPAAAALPNTEPPISGPPVSELPAPELPVSPPAEAPEAFATEIVPQIGVDDAPSTVAFPGNYIGSDATPPPPRLDTGPPFMRADDQLAPAAPPRAINPDEEIPFRSFDRKPAAAAAPSPFVRLLDPLHATWFQIRRSLGGLLAFLGFAVIAGVVGLLAVRDLRAPNVTDSGPNSTFTTVQEEGSPSTFLPTSEAPLLIEPPATNETTTTTRVRRTTAVTTATTAPTTAAPTTAAPTTKPPATPKPPATKPATTKPPTTKPKTTTTKKKRTTTTKKTATTVPPTSNRTTRPPTTNDDGDGFAPEGPTLPLIEGASVSRVRSTTARVSFSSPSCVTATFTYSTSGRRAASVSGGTRCSQSFTLLMGTVTPKLTPGTAYTVKIEATDTNGNSTTQELRFTTLG